jgi:V8-like Glu-specific endopeptidase
MKKISIIFLTTSFMLFFGCGSSVITVVNRAYTSLSENELVTLYELNKPLPYGTEEIGSVKIGDSGVSLNCGWDSVIETAKNASRKMGGNAIKVVSVQEPDPISTCYRIVAKIYRLPEKIFISELDASTDYNLDNLKKEWSQTGTDALEGIYERVIGYEGPKYTLAIKKKTNTEYQAIYISGGDNGIWSEGNLKAKIFRTAKQNIFKVQWYMDDKSINENLYISFDDGTMEVIWADDRPKDMYLKLYPTSEIAIPSSNRTISSSGTGFAINKNGYLLTNHHVIEGANSIRVKGINSNFEKYLDARVLVKDKNSDLAIIKIIDKDFTGFNQIPYVFNSKLSDTGDGVYALGYPLRATMGDEIKLTNGIISSRTGFQGDISTYQISVPVQPGNSGGPLIDNNGNVVGIITAKHLGAENASYAVKISYLMNLLALLDEPVELNNNNLLNNLSLSQQVKSVKNFVYIIECR